MATMYVSKKQDDPEIPTWGQYLRAKAWGLVPCSSMWTHEHLIETTQDQYEKIIADIKETVSLMRAKLERSNQNHSLELERLKLSLHGHGLDTEARRKIGLQIAHVQDLIKQNHQVDYRLISVQQSVEKQTALEMTSSEMVTLLEKHDKLGEFSVLAAHAGDLSEEAMREKRERMSERVAALQSALQSIFDQVSDLQESSSIGTEHHDSYTNTLHTPFVTQRVTEILQKGTLADPTAILQPENQRQTSLEHRSREKQPQRVADLLV